MFYTTVVKNCCIRLVCVCVCLPIAVTNYLFLFSLICKRCQSIVASSFISLGIMESTKVTIDPEKLTPLTQEVRVHTWGCSQISLFLQVISRQATINIGTIGHVAHGKSTLVKAISGVHTVKFKNELERNITIKLGYANAKIYRCSNPECPRPGCYRFDDRFSFCI